MSADGQGAAHVGPGTRLGPYEVTEKLGEGGMGEVYRATDTKLKRQVALKVLPDLFTHNRDRLARFEREAQLLAQLHHPRIASVFGLEESGSVRALVLELVEGPTLGERLASGPLPPEESLGIALEIAEALEVAHEKGIVHRDLKPANVKLTTEGSVKVLDFGLAKALDPTGSDPGSAALEASPTLLNSPTLTAMGTQLGVILGTAAYMSPEQARGKPVDKRADIWAFGVVLYEMLCSRRLFAADSVPDTLAGVLKTEIDWGRLPDSTPPAIRRLLRRCLERDPRNRLRDIGDARLVLQETLAGTLEQDAPAAGQAPAPGRSAWRRWLPWGIAAAAVAGLLFSLAGEPRPRPLYSDLAPPPEYSFYLQGDGGAPAVLSPDGEKLVFGARASRSDAAITGSLLWVRWLATGEQRPLAGTDGGFAPFFSADGRSVGFFAGGELRIVSLTGGSPQSLAAAPNGRGGAWTPDGTIVYSPDFRAPLYKIPATGGKPQELTSIDPERHSTHRWPVLADDGRAVLFLATHHAPHLWEHASVRYIRLDGSGEREVLPFQTNARVAAERLLFLRETTLYAQRFDEGTGEVEGESHLVAHGVLWDPSTWRGTFTATDRRLVLATGIASGTTRLSLFDRSGRRLKQVGEQAFWGDVRFSPDGRTLAVTRDPAGVEDQDVWLIDLEAGTESRLTFEPGPEFVPVWSPDGVWVYYTLALEGETPRRIFRKRASGAGSQEEIFAPREGLDAYTVDISPDGELLLIMLGTFPFERDSDLALVPVDGSAPPLRLFETPFPEGEARFSPDGKYIAYSSQETNAGFGEVFVMALDEENLPRARWQVTREGGRWPIFVNDGSEIVFSDESNNVLAVEVLRQPDGSLRFGPQQPLFAAASVPDRASRDVAPDGRILINDFGEEQSLPLRLIENWTAVLDSAAR